MNLSDRHFLSTLDFPVEEIRALIELARALKADPRRGDLSRRVLGMLFFNPSVRTRMSCTAAMARLGGTAVALNPGRDTWSFECTDDVVMDGATQEHVRELAPVLSRYCDVVGIRDARLATVGSGPASAPSWEELSQDEFLRSFARRSEVPVVNLESNSQHPLQGLADGMTIQERIERPERQKYVLTWTWHPKALPAATPHSQLCAAADLGMDVVVARPEGWSLAPEVLAAADERAQQMGGSVRETDDREGALDGARVVCAKSWGSFERYGDPEGELEAKASLRSRWIVDEEAMGRTDDAFFLHCLPVRRNVVVTDGVLDSPRSAVVDEAENRLWTAAAVLCALTES